MTPPEPPRREIGFHARLEDKGPAAKTRQNPGTMNSTAMIDARRKRLAAKADAEKWFAVLPARTNPTFATGWEDDL